MNRGKIGIKGLTVVDGRGISFVVAADRSHAPDGKLTAATLDFITVVSPEPTPNEQQHRCLDKGYAGESFDRVVRKSNEESRPRSKARPWKVE